MHAALSLANALPGIDPVSLLSAGSPAPAPASESGGPFSGVLNVLLGDGARRVSTGNAGDTGAHKQPAASESRQPGTDSELLRVAPQQLRILNPGQRVAPEPEPILERPALPAGPQVAATGFTSEPLLAGPRNQPAAPESPAARDSRVTAAPASKEADAPTPAIASPPAVPGRNRTAAAPKSQPVTAAASKPERHPVQRQAAVPESRVTAAPVLKEADAPTRAIAPPSAVPGDAGAPERPVRTTRQKEAAVPAPEASGRAPVAPPQQAAAPELRALEPSGEPERLGSMHTRILSRPAVRPRKESAPPADLPVAAPPVQHPAAATPVNELAAQPPREGSPQLKECADGTSSPTAASTSIAADPTASAGEPQAPQTPVAYTRIAPAERQQGAATPAAEAAFHAKIVEVPRADEQQKSAIAPPSPHRPLTAAGEHPRERATATTHPETDALKPEAPAPERVPTPVIDATPTARTETAAAPKEVADARPATPVQHEPAAAAPRKPNNIQVELTTLGQRVQLRVEERGGEMRVAVHTQDSRLAGALREDLPALTAKLEQGGFHAEVWHGGPAAPLREIAADSTASAGEHQSQERSGDQSREREQQDPRPKHDIDEQTKSKSERKDFSWLFTSIT
ncbi:MAG TPA: hypothetical protein VN736_09555 [Candidatus Limnocylindrales bacterium]|nr:hypothetical protein [Candidatus Limnocylindrales bacterium]